MAGPSMDSFCHYHASWHCGCRDFASMQHIANQQMHQYVAQCIPEVLGLPIKPFAPKKNLLLLLLE